MEILCLSLSVRSRVSRTPAISAIPPSVSKPVRLKVSGESSVRRLSKIRRNRRAHARERLVSAMIVGSSACELDLLIGIILQVSVLGQSHIGFGCDAHECCPMAGGCPDDAGAHGAEEAAGLEVALEDERAAAGFRALRKQQQRVDLGIERRRDAMKVGDDEGLRGERAEKLGA